MTKRVLKFKRNAGNDWYEARQFHLCGPMLREYLDVEDEFDLHFSTRKPTDDDEYYVLESGVPERGETEPCWYLADGLDKGTTPTTSDMDLWLTEHFAGERVYVWAVG